MTIAWSGVKKFAGALRSAQRLMGLYPLWWRSCGDVFCRPAKSSAVAQEHQGWKAPDAAAEVQLNPTEGGITCRRPLCARAIGRFGFNGSRALRFPDFSLSDTPQGLRGGAENNPIKSVRMSHTPAVPPHPLELMADDIGSGVIQAIGREYHKRCFYLRAPSRCDFALGSGSRDRALTARLTHYQSSGRAA